MDSDSVSAIRFYFKMHLIWNFKFKHGLCFSHANRR